MDSFEKHGLDASSFGEDSALSAFRSFDAFPKTKPTYTQATSRGGQWTMGVLTLALLLAFTELRTWWAGTESHHFSVERGVGHELQLNLDIVLAMPCQDLHVNIQDASMDRIMAGELLKKEDTTFDIWHTGQAFSSRQRRKKGGFDKNDRGEFYERNRPEDGTADDLRRRAAEEEDSHVTHVLGHMREARSSKKFAKTPRLKRGTVANACRIYGSLEGNKVQGDFHITARGHGYLEGGIGHSHLDHGTFNFSHQINELSFGPHYPALLNPLDKTSDIAAPGQNFMKFQYYLSIVPTIFTKRRVSTRSGALDPAAIPQPPTLDLMPDTHKLKPGEVPKHVEISNTDSKSIFTNQYAATSQSREVPHQVIPGVFFKYDIEPILLIVSEQRGSLAALLVRLVNVVSGIVVAGGWAFALTEWANELMRRRRDRSRSEGVLHGRMGSGDYKNEKFG